MGKYKDSKWYIESGRQLIQEYGDIPPPWVYGPNMHPYSIGWRMGGGETHIMILGEWLDQQDLTFEDRVKYLQKYPAPPRWYQWIISFLWDVDVYEFEDKEYIPYFKKLETLGFKNTSNFREDMEREDLD